MKSWIQNVSMRAIMIGDHKTPGENSMLIQIVDPGYEFPTPQDFFKETYQFNFFDVEERYTRVHDNLKITTTQAKQLVKLLKYALANDMTVTCHCHAGLCRSGAIAEVGVMMGFNDVGTYRIPNVMVKKMLINELGWGYE